MLSKAEKRRQKQLAIAESFGYTPEVHQQLSIGTKNSHAIEIASSTKRHHDSLYERFLDFCGATGKPLPVHGGKFPEAEILKEFALYHVNTSQGRQDKRISVQTVQTNLTNLMSAIKRKIEVPYTQSITSQVQNYISTELREACDLKNISRFKPTGSVDDVQRLLHSIWCCDQSLYGRRHVQLAFLLLLITFTGNRPGCLVESSEYVGSNLSLKYKVNSSVYIFGACQ